MSDADCLFCRIVSGEIPATVVHRTETTVAFRDINPQAPTHVLVIPRVHYPDAASLAVPGPGALAVTFGLRDPAAAEACDRCARGAAAFRTTRSGLRFP